MTEIEQESIFIEDGAHQLHLRHIFAKNKDEPLNKHRGEPVFMIHGAIENGKIFYSLKGKGLACFLASQGFDVYVADLRGRGQTQPIIAPFDEYGQTETICHDLPLFLNKIKSLNPNPVHIMAHSWGGVLASSMFIRMPELLNNVRSQVFFGTKRRVKAFNMEVLFKIKFMWRTLGPRLTKKHGLLKAKKLGFGSDDETIKSHQQGMVWTKSANWVDSDDGFDYQKASEHITWPPTWFIAATNDKALGHPADVQRFMKEAGYKQANYSLLSRKNGNARDYNHITMLTDSACIDDHFTHLVIWLNNL